MVAGRFHTQAAFCSMGTSLCLRLCTLAISYLSVWVALGAGLQATSVLFLVYFCSASLSLSLVGTNSTVWDEMLADLEMEKKKKSQT